MSRARASRDPGDAFDRLEARLLELAGNPGIEGLERTTKLPIGGMYECYGHDTTNMFFFCSDYKGYCYASIGDH
jgi:hypothetical protein